jgi:hypothetical protein
MMHTWQGLGQVHIQCIMCQLQWLLLSISNIELSLISCAFHSVAVVHTCVPAGCCLSQIQADVSCGSGLVHHDAAHCRSGAVGTVRWTCGHYQKRAWPSMMTGSNNLWSQPLHLIQDMVLSVRPS